MRVCFSGAVSARRQPPLPAQPDAAPLGFAVLSPAGIRGFQLQPMLAMLTGGIV